jgi:DNA-directed RNA polymerase specialized sigma subunit
LMLYVLIEDEKTVFEKVYYEKKIFEQIFKEIGTPESSVGRINLEEIMTRCLLMP